MSVAPPACPSQILNVKVPGNEDDLYRMAILVMTPHFGAHRPLITKGVVLGCMLHLSGGGGGSYS